MADEAESATESVAARPRRPWWWHVWGWFLFLLVLDVFVMLVGPLLWAGATYNAATLKFTLFMALGVDLLLSFGMVLDRVLRHFRNRRPRD